ncbi:IS110 family transposase [Nocardia sp. CWNU-33]|uniref:IS110 family transposase n=1 Tax=Nocardia sp. CWNU-33 TaxID=3392117 RepID=UPI00398F2CDE
MAVIIGMDPHKHSATIEVIDETGRVLATGRYRTEATGYAEMLTATQRFTDRVWAVEGCNGIGRDLAHRLVHDGETVIDVPAKLSAQVRVFATGNGRKTDPVDAHSVVLAALHAPNLRRVTADPELIALGMLADRRDELGRARTETLCRLHRLLLELIAGGAKQFLLGPPSPRADRDDHTERRGRAGPAATGRRADRGPGNHRPQDQSCGQGVATTDH